ncbi:MAG: type IV secretion system protein [Deltaproteobacteria bacterium]|nr:type IV secretion system protein [Deltaproteobacteria bacterium]
MSLFRKTTFKDDPVVTEWYYDLYRSAQVSRNRWFLVGVIALLITGIEGFSLLFLTPLKTVEPYVLQVDNKSGMTSVLKPLKDGKENSLTEEEAITKSFIVKYVVSRETYDPQDLNRNYDLVRLMSSSDEAKRFDDEVSNSNPNSPVERFKTTTTRTVRIRSVSFLDQKKKIAQLRFVTTETGRNENKEEYWVAILSFRYINAPMDENDRLNNPLGFQVISYRIDQEIIK